MCVVMNEGLFNALFPSLFESCFICWIRLEELGCTLSVEEYGLGTVRKMYETYISSDDCRQFRDEIDFFFWLGVRDGFIILIMEVCSWAMGLATPIGYMTKFKMKRPYVEHNVRPFLWRRKDLG